MPRISKRKINICQFWLGHPRFRWILPTRFHPPLALSTGFILIYLGFISSNYPIYAVSSVAANVRQQILAGWFLHLFLFMGKNFWHHLSTNISHVQIILRTTHLSISVRKRSTFVPVQMATGVPSREASSTDSHPSLNRVAHSNT